MEVRQLAKKPISDAEKITADTDWNSFIDLEIQAHPRLNKNRCIVEYEYRMSSGTLIKRIRKALAGYLLDSWNIDVSEDARLEGQHVLLHLKNTTSLDFNSKILAPGEH